jgi:hypothetical protein
VHDKRVFDTMPLNNSPELFFADGEFILGDSAYVLSQYMLMPYTGEDASSRENVEFNQVFSGARVIIEHVMGLLKGRWSSLRGIRIQIKTKADFVRVNRWILCCLILHNIVLFCNDQWELDAEDLAREAQDRVAVAAMANRPPASSALGVQLRNRVKRDIQEKFY